MPGTIFSRPLGKRGGKRAEETMEREYWEEVSSCLQVNHGLGAFQARKKIYELEERFIGATYEVVELLYHDEPVKQARKMMQ